MIGRSASSQGMLQTSSAVSQRTSACSSIGAGMPRATSASHTRIR